VCTPEWRLPQGATGTAFAVGTPLVIANPDAAATAAVQVRFMKRDGTPVPDEGYWVCWDTSDNGSCDSAWWPNGGATARVLEGLSAGTYYWQVKTAGGGVQADNGAWHHFTVGAAPLASSTAGLSGGGAPGLGSAEHRSTGRAYAAGVAGAAALAQTTTQVVEYYTTDAIGSVRAVTQRVNGVLQVTHHDFMPFGEEVAPPTASQDKRLFTGKERDAETGQDYFEARYLRAGLGRFTSPDPIRANTLRLVSPLRWNAYAYAKSNPLTYVDRDGRDAAYVNFSQMAHGFGHAGILLVRPDGTATYSRSGPLTAGSAVDQNQVRTTDALPTVVFSSAGLPTEESYGRLVAAVAAFEKADPSTVSIAYFKTNSSETAALDSYIRLHTKLSDEGALPKYRVIGNSCLDYAVGGLGVAGRVGWFGRRLLSNAPNQALGYIGWWADDYRKESGLKPQVTTSYEWCVQGSQGCSTRK
jgi:RHS repeat-associated protein